MNTSSVYIRAAELAVVDAVKSLPADKRFGRATYSFGLDAVRDCGYKTTRVTLSNQGRNDNNDNDPVVSACYIVASIPDHEIVQLLTTVNPGIPSEQRIRSLMNSTAFKARVTKYAAAMKRKIASISADILLSFASRALLKRTAHLQMTLDYRSRELTQLQVGALHESTKKGAVISSLLACRTRTMNGVQALVSQLDAAVRAVDKMFTYVPSRK